MGGAVRKGQDTAGGILIQGSNNVKWNSAAAVRIGDSVAPHGYYEHASPVMAEGSGNVFVNGIPACRSGDSATCGHTASGSNNVKIN